MMNEQIYLMDEDEGVRDSLRILLESHGLKVQDFGSGDALLAEATARPGDCLIVGSNRLIVDRLALLSALRRRGISTPTIFVVGGGDSSTKASALAGGAVAYLERPVEERALVRAVKTALQQAAG